MMKLIHRRRLKSLMCGMIAAVVPGIVCGGDNWPAFQNAGEMSLTSATVHAGMLESEPAWSADITGYGQSSPVFWGEHIYVTSVEGDQKQSCHVTAYRLSDGERLWQHSLPNASPAENSNYVSKAAPTPAADADGVICFFEGGNVAALTHAGEVRWERDLVADYGEIAARHGLSASVEQDETSVYVWVERATEPYVLSLDKQTGRTNWKVPGLGATSWASPRLVPVAGGRHLVLSGIGSLVGLDPATGERLWVFDQINGNSTPTPVPAGEGRFLIGATVGRGDAGGGGGEGEGRAAESNGLVAITKSDDGGWQADYVWRARRATSSFGSPIAHDGMAYFVNRTGVLYGLDVATGEEQFARRISGSIWATPLGVGERVYFFGKDGRIDVLTAADDGEQVSTWSSLPGDSAPPQEAGDGPPVGGSVLYAAVLTSDLMLLRRGDRLFAFPLSTSPAGR
jgi:outer membrane protein assembly factor BamB